MSSSANYDIYNHVGHSTGWHALDHGVGNPNAGLLGFGSSTPGLLWGAQFGDARKLTASTTFTLPAINHISVCIRMCDALFTTGGGVEVDGWGHNYEFIEASSGGENTQLSHERGVGARVWHCDFNNNLGNWGSGSRGCATATSATCTTSRRQITAISVACRTQGEHLHGRRHGDQRLPVLTVRCLQVAHDAAPACAPPSPGPARARRRSHGVA